MRDLFIRRWVVGWVGGWVGGETYVQEDITGFLHEFEEGLHPIQSLSFAACRRGGWVGWVGGQITREKKDEAGKQEETQPLTHPPTHLPFKEGTSSSTIFTTATFTAWAKASAASCGVRRAESLAATREV